MTIRGFQYLWHVLHTKHQFQYLNPRNVNLDALDHFFSQIRSHAVRNINPNATSFINSYKTLLMNNCLSSKSPASICQDDFVEGLMSTLKVLVKSSSSETSNVSCRKVMLHFENCLNTRRVQKVRFRIIFIFDDAASLFQHPHAFEK